MYRYLIILIVFTEIVIGQNLIIDKYIKLAIQNNLYIKQQTFTVQQSFTDLDEARGLFFPSVDLKARYTRADGGRQIEIPVGDLVNPIYTALNIVNPQFGFPTNIPNESVPFLRKEEQETKVSLLQPIVQPELFYNYSIKSNLVEIEKLGRDISIREIIHETKRSYLNILRTQNLIKLYKNSLQLLSENVRVNESLYKNDKVTIDVVHRAKAEKIKIEQLLVEAEKDHDLAKSYFNHLLNRELDSPIDIDEIKIEQKQNLVLVDLEIEALRNREELKQLETLIEVAENSKGAANSSYFPNLFLAAEYGYQGENYDFDSESDYWIASLVFNWNLFNGLRDNSKSEKAELEIRKQSLQLNELTNKIKLQVREAYKNYILAKKIIEVSDERSLSSKMSFNIVNKKYKQGLVSQVEYLDSQNQLLQSEISSTLAGYSLMESYFDLEKITADLDLISLE